jgi:hypothetical protein
MEETLVIKEVEGKTIVELTITLVGLEYNDVIKITGVIKGKIDKPNIYTLKEVDIEYKYE